MAKRTRYSEYKDRYANYRFELSEEGILLMQCHTDGGSLVWDWKAHDEMSDAFADVAGDREIKVLIHTGTGENYNANWGPAPVEKPLYKAMAGPQGLMASAKPLVSGSTVRVEPVVPAMIRSDHCLNWSRRSGSTPRISQITRTGSGMRAW